MMASQDIPGMGEEGQICVALKILARDEDDPLHIFWQYVVEKCDNEGSRSAVKLMARGVAMQQAGAAARREREFNSCPFAPFDGAPLSDENALRISWMAGYEAQDYQERARQAESKIYSTYKEMTKVREFFEYMDRWDLNGTFENLIHQFAKIVRNLHGTMLTSAVKQRIRAEEERERELKKNPPVEPE